MAFELEFYLFNENKVRSLNFDSPEFTNVLSITDIENHEEFFDELYDLCKKKETS